MRSRQTGILSMQPTPLAFSWFPFVFVELGRQKVGKKPAKSRQKVGKMISWQVAAGGWVKHTIIRNQVPAPVQIAIVRITFTLPE